MRSVQVSNRHKRLRCSSAQVRALFRFLDSAIEEDFMPDGDLSVALLEREEMCQLHDQFLNDPEHTDVITFPGDEDMSFAGEICVSADFAEESAKNLGLPFEEELTLYLVHGWLHLAGYDDRNDEDRAQMRKAEARVMKAVREAAKTPAFSLA